MPPLSLAETEPQHGSESTSIEATPYRWRNPETLPRRPWIFGRWLLRGSVFVVIAPGATGKSALMTGVALSLCTGRNFIGQTVWDGPKRVWLWNLEDSGVDLAFAIQAAALHWDIAEADIAGRLYVDSGLDGATLRLAIRDNSGTHINAGLSNEIINELRQRAIDALIIDPFISSHGLADENDNAAVDAVAKEWARIATAANCAIVLVHHSRKGGGEEVTAESARGASSLVDAARGGLALNTMSKKQTEEFGIEERDRRRFFRADDAKPNRAPPGSGQWFELVSSYLGNGLDGGDSVGVATPWKVPDPFDGMSVDHLRKVQARVSDGSWRESHQATDWVGKAIAEELGLNLDNKPERGKVKSILKTWLSNGALRVEERQDHKRELRKFVVVGDPA